MADQTSNMVDMADGTDDQIFGQVYSTPVSIMWFRLSGVANGDYVDLSTWFQCVYSVHAVANNDQGGTADTFSVQISGTYPANCGPVIILHDPRVATTIYDFMVIGHKAEDDDAALY